MVSSIAFPSSGGFGPGEAGATVSRGVLPMGPVVPGDPGSSLMLAGEVAGDSCWPLHIIVTFNYESRYSVEPRNIMVLQGITQGK